MEKSKQKKLNDDLIQASIDGDKNQVNILLNLGADIHDGEDYSLIKASEYGHYEVVELLLKRGANVNGDNCLAIRYASNRGQLDVVKLLISNGANIKNDDDIALIVAIENDHLEVAKLLIKNGADIDRGIAHSRGSLKYSLIDYKTSIIEKTLLNNDIKNKDFLNGDSKRI